MLELTFQKTSMIVTPLKIFICFMAALISTVILRFALGKRRDQWFTRSVPRSYLTIRGAFGYYLSLGYPVTWQGFVVLGGLLLCIAAEIALILYFPWG